MGKSANHSSSPDISDTERATAIEAALKAGLSRGDRALRGVPPVLTHMLASSGQSLVTDAIIAKLRGMLHSLATQLIKAKDAKKRGEETAIAADRLADHLAGDSVILSYCYALAMEGYLAERLERRASVDPVLTPLLQELIASQNDETAEIAMATLAAQSRFMQSQRRMDLPFSELPAELFHVVLRRWEATEKNDPATAPAVTELKSSYDEGASRVGLLARLVAAMKGGAIAALELEHAGLALFVSALSAKSQQPRELAILACHENQSARLMLSLRAAGLSAQAIERQFLLLEPSERLPEGAGDIDPERASALLRNSNARDAG